MAKLQVQADRATIIANRGLIDFYYWKGIPVARRWPRKSTQPRTAGEILSSERFTAAAIMTGAIDAEYMAFLKRSLPAGQGVTWVDWFRANARRKTWVEIDGS